MNRLSPTPLPFDILVFASQNLCQQQGRSLTATLAQMLREGPWPRVAILIREKQQSVEQVEQLLTQVGAVVRDAGALLMVHSYATLAQPHGLDGVHLSATTNLESIREQFPKPLMIGVSRHGHDALDAADIGAATYATISPVFPPTSKPGDRRPPLGLTGLEHCLNRSCRPLVALGGLGPGRIQQAIALGAAAVAVSGALLQSADPAQVLHAIDLELQTARAKPTP